MIVWKSKYLLCESKFHHPIGRWNLEIHFWNEDYYKLVVEGFLKIGYNEEEAQIKALENLQINFDIKFKEVTDYDCIWKWRINNTKKI